MRFLFPTLILLAIGIAIFSKMQPNVPTSKDNASSEVTKEVEYKLKFYSGLAQKPDPKTVEEEVRNRITQDKLVLAYADKRGITVSDNEVEKRLEELSRGAGSKEKYLNDIKERYGIDKDAYLGKLRIELLRQKVEEYVKKPLIEWLLEEKKMKLKY